MRQTTRGTALALAASMGVSIFAAGSADASKEGRRNTGIALGAVAAYGIVKKNPTIAGLAGAGAIYSLTRSTKSSNDSRRRKRQARLRRQRRLARARDYDRAPVYYAPRRTVYVRRDDDDLRSAPPGWSRGRKVGWEKHGGHPGRGHGK